MKVYDCEELVARYGRVIIEHVRQETQRASDEVFSNISAICHALNVTEYDWKDSSEGFENWVVRMVEEGNFPESVKNELLSLWKRHKSADEEFKAVYYGSRHSE